MLQNISDIHSCYGCGVCAIACSKQIINLHLNKDGFMSHIYQNQTNAQTVVCVEKSVLIAMRK